MRKIALLIIILFLIPSFSYSLDEMKDKDLDQVTARFGVGAVQDAAPLAAPAGDVNAMQGDVTPLTPAVSAAAEAGGRVSDQINIINDVTPATTAVSNASTFRNAVGLGVF